MWIASVLIIIVLVIGITAYQKSPKCPKCGSHDVKDGYYTRGWNHLCSQSWGDRGIFCGSCHKVSFNNSVERCLSTLPEWCDHDERPIKPVYAWFIHHEDPPAENSTQLEGLEDEVYAYVMNRHTSVEDKADVISDLYERVYNQSGDRIHPADDVVTVFLEVWDKNH